MTTATSGLPRAGMLTGSAWHSGATLSIHSNTKICGAPPGSRVPEGDRIRRRPVQTSADAERQPTRFRLAVCLELRGRLRELRGISGKRSGHFIRFRWQHPSVWVGPKIASE
eukprot:scaffold434_cov186-Pinguiococcus_pyrenoidosus.AAC.150